MSQICRWSHWDVPIGGTIGGWIGLIDGVGIGAIAGGCGGTMSSELSQSGTCRQLPPVQSNSQVQAALAIVVEAKRAMQVNINLSMSTLRREGGVMTDEEDDICGAGLAPGPSFCNDAKTVRAEFTMGRSGEARHAKNGGTECLRCERSWRQ